MSRHYAIARKREGRAKPVRGEFDSLIKRWDWMAAKLDAGYRIVEIGVVESEPPPSSGAS